jgi:RES domain-containing protein
VVLKVPTKRFRWQPGFRIVPTRYPSISIFDRVADAREFDALYALEEMTNDRFREEAGKIDLVAPEDRVFGPGSGPVMAAFTHLNPLGSRFSDGSFGVLYAAQSRATAIVETKYHHSRFLRATAEGAMHLPMRVYGLDLDADLSDMHGYGDAAIFNPDSYAASQRLGRQLRDRGSAGVGYPSVRDPGGECVGIFKPRCVSWCRELAQLLYIWNGSEFSDVYERSS